MIDLHCHCLPGVDDGPDLAAEALELCRQAAADGCTALVATPHQHHPLWDNDDRGELLRRVEELAAAAEAALGGALRILPGAEIRVGSETLDEVDRLPGGSLLPLAGSRYLLLEFSRRGEGPDPVETVHELSVSGWRPIVAHPEMYAWLDPTSKQVDALLEAGAMMQVTAMSVTGEFGGRAHAACAELLRRGAVHFVASDAHGVEHRPPGLGRARARLAERYGDPVARALTEDNPRAVVEDRALTLS